MNRKEIFNWFLNLIFGLASLAGLIISIVSTLKINPTDSTNTVPYLAFSNILITAVFTIASFYYLKQLTKLSNMQRDMESEIDRNKKKEIIIKNTSELIINVTYYQGIINTQMDIFLDNGENSIDNVKNISKSFEKFLDTFTTLIQSYLTLVTGDNCAITIKLLKASKVKTFWRDAISYRARRDSDFINSVSFIYDVSQNFAFHVINSPDYKNYHYYCDDLKNNSEYRNANPTWHNHYNATIVAPIICEEEDQRKEILGFVCADNFNGGFAQKPVESIMISAGQILFNVFLKYSKIANFADSKKYDDKTAKNFNSWSNS